MLEGIVPVRERVRMSKEQGHKPLLFWERTTGGFHVASHTVSAEASSQQPHAPEAPGVDVCITQICLSEQTPNHGEKRGGEGESETMCDCPSLPFMLTAKA